jgi:hypothetical protein
MTLLSAVFMVGTYLVNPQDCLLCYTPPLVCRDEARLSVMESSTVDRGLNGFVQITQGLGYRGVKRLVFQRRLL